MKTICLTISMVALIALTASAQTTRSTQSADERLDFGVEHLTFPPATIVNGHTARTAQLLGEAYRRKEPLVWKRVQHVAELGLVARAEGAPFIVDAMKDESPAVRAEAARSASKIADASLMSALAKLLRDPEPSLRREAVLAAAALGGADAVETGLTDQDISVVAAALRSASSAAHAKLIAQVLPNVPDAVKPEGANALGRLKVAEHAPAIVPLLKGDVVQRVAALQALGELANATVLDAVPPMLNDSHPSVRREAITALGKLAPAAEKHASAIRMLSDADHTVRQAAAAVLTPLPSTEALAAIALQLDVDYAPLHEAVRAALAQPADATVRQATIDLAAKMLQSPNPRRREDASYILGRLRSDAAIEQHVALLQWDAKEPAKSDWPLVAQAAESLGLIGNVSGVESLMALITPVPQSLANLTEAELNAMGRGLGNAMIALARLGHQPALTHAVRILNIEPGMTPIYLRDASAFAVGMLAPTGGKGKEANVLWNVYDDIYEVDTTRIEALKALGNLRHAPAASRLKDLAENHASVSLRWMAHWSYQRCSNQTIPYVPPTERRAPDVSIIDMSK